MNEENPTTAISPFERIRRTNPAVSEFWSSRDFAQVLGYTDYRNFEGVIEKARTACFNSGQRVEDSWKQEKGHPADHPCQQKHLVGRSEVGQVPEAGEVFRPLHMLAR